MTPVDRPTVPNALLTSKRASDNGKFVNSNNVAVDNPMTRALIATTATARRTVDGPIRLPNASMSRLPRTSATIARTITAKVVTLIPPAVDAEPPPINIMMEETNQDAVHRTHINRGNPQ
ncbi:Uncharacterised protein [Mobiluncus curtisii]|uniref:Uncharacterized protein n=1 Tax=Mobiluncus curtisii TaxID=2051 RepID=A0A2X3BIK4_9ACTO|nr:Uncharacterised protein [Mobiluncus curtisii]